MSKGKAGNRSVEERLLSQCGIDRTHYSVPLPAKSTPELPSGQGPGHYSASASWFQSNSLLGHGLPYFWAALCPNDSLSLEEQQAQNEMVLL